MMYTLNPIGAFAKEVEGLSLWETQDELTIARLADIWSRHGVLVFRRQVLSETELVAFSRSYGDPDVIVREDWSSSHTPEVIQISNMKNYHGQSIGGLGAGELGWHTDQSYMIAPATGSILYMVEMPPEPPLTYWANLQLAYAALPEHRKDEINDLHVVYDYSVRQSTYDDESEMPSEMRRKTPPVAASVEADCHAVAFQVGKAPSQRERSLAEGRPRERACPGRGGPFYRGRGAQPRERCSGQLQVRAGACRRARWAAACPRSAVAWAWHVYTRSWQSARKSAARAL